MGCTLLRGALPAPALFFPLLQPEPHCQDPQVHSSPVPRSPRGSGCKLAPMPSVTPLCVTHVPEIRSAVENCHNKYAVNLRRLSAIISPEPEGRETACCNVLLFCYRTGLCNVLLSKPSKGGRPSWSLSARQRSRMAPARAEPWEVHVGPMAVSRSRVERHSRATLPAHARAASARRSDAVAPGGWWQRGWDTGTPLTTITDVRLGALLLQG